MSVIESGVLKICPERRPIAELVKKSVYLNNINAAAIDKESSMKKNAVASSL